MAIDDIWEELATLDDDDYEARRKVFDHWESMDNVGSESKTAKPSPTQDTPSMSSAIFSVAASGGAI